jgi:methyl-accepting chemotaxis protein
MGKVRSRLLSRFSIKTKLVFWFLIAAVLPLLVAGYLSYGAIARQADQSAAREMVALAESASKTATAFMDGRCGDLLIWSNLRFIKEALELAEIREEVCESLREMVELSGGYEAVVLVDAGTGRCAASSRPELFDMDFSQNGAFTRAKGGKLDIGALERSKIVEQIDKESGGWTLTIAAPVKFGEQVRGVLLAFLRWNSIETPLLSTKVGQSGCVFIVDNHDRVIVHPKRSYYGLPLTDRTVNLMQLGEAIKLKKPSVAYEASNSATGKHEFRIAGIAYPKPVRNQQDLEWKIGVYAPASEVLLLPNIVGTLGTIVCAVVVVVAALSLILAGRISRPISAIADVARKVADYDLTVEAPDLARTDEIGDLSRAFGSMLESLKMQITQVLQGSDVLKGAVQQITSSVSEVAAGSAQVAGSVSETATTLEQLRRAAKISGDKAKSLAEMANDALGASIQGREATEGSLQGIRTIKEQIEIVGETVAKLSEQSVSIKEIVASVGDLAEQSNLLAVNASIEAARAGESGKGFSVVAQEIKSLADQSRQSTLQIGDILDNIRKSISAVVMSMEQVNAALETGIGQSSKTEESIAILNQSVELSSREASFIESASSQQNIGMDQVSDAMVSIEQAMNQNLGVVSQLEDAARKLADLGEQIRKSVEGYRT